MRIKSLVIAAAAAGVAICVSGCDPTTTAGPASTTQVSQPAQNTQPGQGQPGQTTQPGASSPGGIDHDGDNAGAPVTTPGQTTPPKCVTGQITLDKGHGGPVGGDWFLKFINSSSKTCVIQGFPGVSQTNGPTGDPVGEPAERDQGADAPKPTPVVLTPGAAAQFEFITYPKQVNNCDALRTNTLRVYPPDNTESMWLPWDSLICPGPQRMLIVRAVTPVS
ncbi:DUF4232 domain-containing protein [Nocardia sp. CDC153]|uniref:DUF4232 domain-containing protein n=1 Tax=Nocardia sp. CDC153 TaxID=3112167 RepID=UPI002DB9EE12|nr:DUF4232 domain-containing protein [Nocardia sp. CDC153]MEC3956286.1 DUF4232 domain-containing protein [Nocardia sp. CDC153]